MNVVLYIVHQLISCSIVVYISKYMFSHSKKERSYGRRIVVTAFFEIVTAVGSVWVAE